jgi:hypothetical protein
MLTASANSAADRGAGDEPTATILALPVRTVTDFGPGVNITGSSGGASEWARALDPSRMKTISIGVLYQAREAGSKNFNRALELLEEASEALSEAKVAVESKDLVARASEVMRFERLLAPLFECREIGEGFANVINAVHMSIANLHGEPLDDDQIIALWRIVREVASAPFFGFQESLKFVRDLELVGLRSNNDFLVSWASELLEIGEQ